MSKRTYICFECRTTKRADAAHGLNTEYRCSQCQGKLYELPWNWRIPKQSESTEWNKLKKMYIELERCWLPRKMNEGKAQLQKIDKKIEAISKQKDSQEKESKLKYLKWIRKETEAKYTEQSA